MSVNRVLLILALSIGFFHTDADAQLFKKKKKKEQGAQFVLKTAPTPEEQAKALQKQLISPVRKQLNRFNLNIEKGVGFFTYQNQIQDAVVVQDASGSPFYLVPSGGERPIPTPVTGYTDWFSNAQSVQLERIDDDSNIFGSDTTDFVYRNNGRINPLIIRLSFSLKKLDRAHYERTGERIYLDDDMLRVGAGIGFGRLKFRNPVNQQEVGDLLRQYRLPQTSFSATKLFGTLSYNLYTLGDFSAIADVMGGVWRLGQNNGTVDNTVITYDPFVDVGFMFQKRFSKYFKGYVRPGFEYRKFNVAAGDLAVPHQFFMFSVSVGVLLKYPIYPRNKYQADQVQMEHVFNGRLYRGRPFYQNQNPRYGQNRKRRKPQGSYFPKPKKTKEKKAKNGN